MKTEKISIVFPVFGKFNRDKLLLAIKSVQIQDYPNIEIIISEQNATPTCKEISKRNKLKYKFSTIEEGRGEYNIGFVRNQGIKFATGKYIYLTDSDIVFMDKSYLSNVCKLFKKYKPSHLGHPPMKRLLEEHFKDFYKNVEENGVMNALNLLSFPDGYTTTTSKGDQIKVFKYGYYMKKYTLPLKEFKKLSKADKEKYGYGLFFFTYHAGAIFTETKRVVSLGGYYEGFKGWGYDDVDLQVRISKLAKKRSRSIPKTSQFNVLHLDHKNNFSKSTYIKNEKLFFERTEMNFKKLMKIDVKTNKF
jgi:glycosyltransferase involved in cell wall biosynthesis